MLGPEYLDEAADLVGAVYTEIEDEMLRYLSRLLLSGVDVLGQRGETALLLLAQARAADLMAIVERHRGDVSRAVEATVADAIARSDAAALAVLGDAALPRAEGTLPMQASLTARGIAEVLARDNVDMQSGALALWQSVVSRAVTRVNTGASTTEAALHAAVREMMRSGISAVTYRDAETGRQTVTNRVDVAVRRHVRTQIQQDGLRRTMELCRASGCRLVEVTSHCGARPSHAEWQGNVYGLDGPCEVEGVSYRGLADATGYGSVDGLGGANCRHSFGPWAPGTPRAYQPDPPHPSGLSNDEVYRLRQGQRRRERAIRQAKRDLTGAQMCYEDRGDVNDLAAVLRAQDALSKRQADMRAFIERSNGLGSAPVLHRNPRREWAGDMPRTTLAASAQSKRRAREVLDLKKRCARKHRPVYTEGKDDFGANMRANFGKLAKEHEGEFLVGAHGSPQTVRLLGERSDHRTLADVIRARRDYSPGTPIRLFSCSTGREDGGDCIAQRLANELGVQVTAPTDKLWLWPDGTVAIGRELGDNDGEWITFNPRGGADAD